MAIEVDPLGRTSELLDWLSGNPEVFGLGASSDLANWTGRVINAYSAIEFNFYLLYAILSDADPSQSYVTYYQARAINFKEELLFKSAAVLPQVYKDALIRLCRHMRGAADRRSQVAHCILIRKEDQLLRVRLVGRKCFFEKIGKEYFLRTLDQFRTLLTEVRVYLLFLQYLMPGRSLEKLSKLPLPQHKDSGLPVVPLGRPPQHLANALEHVKRRIGLSHVVVFENPVYPHGHDYTLAFGELLILPQRIRLPLESASPKEGLQ